VKAAAETFARNPKLDVTEAIGTLGTGEALASMLGDGGVPSPVQKVLVSTPTCRIGTITDDERRTIRSRSPVGAKYDTAVDRESAEERLAARASAKSAAETPPVKTAREDGDAGSGWGGVVRDAVFGTGRRQGMIETMAKSMVRTAGSQAGQRIVRGILGSIFGGKR
jgi:DNA helicase HerA-like ATPase